MDQGFHMDKKKNDILPVLAIVFAFLFPFAGFVLAIISLAKKCGKEYLSAAALVISVIWSNILVIIISFFIVLGGLFIIIVQDPSAYEQSNAEEKKLTNYYYDSPIVSARYFHREEGELVYDDIPEDQIKDLVKTLDSLTIVDTKWLHADYYYGMQRGVECTLEDGTYFIFDGESLEYYAANGERVSSRFIYLDKPFDEVMDEFFASHNDE